MSATAPATPTPTTAGWLKNKLRPALRCMFGGEIPIALKKIINNLHDGKIPIAHPRDVLAMSSLNDNSVAEFRWYLLVVHGMALGDGGLFELERVTSKDRSSASPNPMNERDAMERLEMLGVDFEALASFEPFGKDDRMFYGKSIVKLRNQWIRKHQERPLTAADLFIHPKDGPYLRRGHVCLWASDHWEVLRATTKKDDKDINRLFVHFLIGRQYMRERGASAGLREAWTEVARARKS